MSWGDCGFAFLFRLLAICASLDQTKKQGRGCGKSTYPLLIPSVLLAVGAPHLGPGPVKPNKLHDGCHVAAVAT